MSFQNPDREQIKNILEHAGNIAVVGLSDKSDRTSYMVAQALQNNGYRIIPVNPSVSGQILGEQTYPSLQDVPEAVDIVNVFRQSQYTPEVAEAAVEVGAKVLWLQQGIVNDEAYEIASTAGLTVIMDRCIKVEDSLLIGKRS
jgi:predicted CoA-binding protein